MFPNKRVTNTPPVASTLAKSKEKPTANPATSYYNSTSFRMVKPSVKAVFSVQGKDNKDIYVLPSKHKYSQDKVILLDRCLELIADYLDRKGGNTPDNINNLFELIIESIAMGQKETGIGADVELKNSIYLLSQKRGILHNNGLIRGVQKLIALLCVLAMKQKNHLNKLFREDGSLDYNQLNSWLEKHKKGHVLAPLAQGYVDNIKLLLDNEKHVIKFGNTYNNTITLDKNSSFSVKADSGYRSQLFHRPFISRDVIKNAIDEAESINPNSKATKKEYFRDYAEKLFTILNRDKTIESRKVLEKIVNIDPNCNPSSESILAEPDEEEAKLPDTEKSLLALNNSLTELARNRGVLSVEKPRGLQMAMALFYITHEGVTVAFDRNGLFRYDKFHDWCAGIEDVDNRFITPVLTKRYFSDIKLTEGQNGLSIINFGKEYDVSIEVINPELAVKNSLFDTMVRLSRGGADVETEQPDWEKLESIESEAIKVMGSLGYHERDYTIEGVLEILETPNSQINPDAQIFLELAVNIFRARVVMTCYKDPTAENKNFKDDLTDKAEKFPVWNYLHNRLTDILNSNVVGVKLSNFLHGNNEYNGDIDKFMASAAGRSVIWSFHDNRTWIEKYAGLGLFEGNTSSKESVHRYLNDKEDILRDINSAEHIISPKEESVFYYKGEPPVSLGLSSRPGRLGEMRGKAFVSAFSSHLVTNPTSNLYEFFTQRAQPSVEELIGSFLNISACNVFALNGAMPEDEKIKPLINYLMAVTLINGVRECDKEFSGCKKLYLDSIINTVHYGLIPDDNLESLPWKLFLIEKYVSNKVFTSVKTNISGFTQNDYINISVPNIVVNEYKTFEVNHTIMNNFGLIYSNLSNNEKKSFITEFRVRMKEYVEIIKQDKKNMELNVLECDHIFSKMRLDQVDEKSQDDEKSEGGKPQADSITYASFCDNFFDGSLIQSEISSYFQSIGYENKIINALLFAVKDRYAKECFTYNEKNMDLLRAHILNYEGLKEYPKSVDYVEIYCQYLLQATYYRTIKPVASPSYKSSSLRDVFAYWCDSFNDSNNNQRMLVAKTLISECRDGGNVNGDVAAAIQGFNEPAEQSVSKAESHKAWQNLNKMQNYSMSAQKPASYYYALFGFNCIQHANYLFQMQSPIVALDDIFKKWMENNNFEYDPNIKISDNVIINKGGNKSITIKFKSTRRTDYSLNSIKIASLNDIIEEVMDNIDIKLDGDIDISRQTYEILSKYFGLVNNVFKPNPEIGCVKSPFFACSQRTLNDLQNKQKLYNTLFDLIKNYDANRVQAIVIGSLQQIIVGGLKAPGKDIIKFLPGILGVAKEQEVKDLNEQFKIVGGIYSYSDLKSRIESLRSTLIALYTNSDQAEEIVQLIVSPQDVFNNWAYFELKESLIISRIDELVLKNSLSSEVARSLKTQTHEYFGAYREFRQNLLKEFYDLLKLIDFQAIARLPTKFQKMKRHLFGQSQNCLASSQFVLNCKKNMYNFPKNKLNSDYKRRWIDLAIDVLVAGGKGEKEVLQSSYDNDEINILELSKKLKELFIEGNCWQYPATANLLFYTNVFADDINADYYIKLLWNNYFTVNGADDGVIPSDMSLFNAFNFVSSILSSDESTRDLFAQYLLTYHILNTKFDNKILSNYEAIIKRTLGHQQEPQPIKIQFGDFDDEKF